jgi:hypothetical protein
MALIRDLYVNLALICFTSFVLIILVNVGLHYFYQWHDRTASTHFAAPLASVLQQAYPNWKDADLYQLLHETQMRPYVREEYTGFRERPVPWEICQRHRGRLPDF